jgi:hypothetical protein
MKLPPPKPTQVVHDRRPWNGMNWGPYHGNNNVGGPTPAMRAALAHALMEKKEEK